MDIAAFINTHADPALTADTADSVNLWMTKKIMVLVDGAGWHHFANKPFPYPLYHGLVHGRSKSPYRNVLFGLMEIYKRFPNVNWYCYVESDCLFTNNSFKSDLCLGKSIGGFNYRSNGPLHLPLLNEAVGGAVRDNHYLLGAILFMSRGFVARLMQDNIPNKILKVTENLISGEFPDFHGFAFEEELFPSLANYYSPGSVFQLGDWSKYNVRWQPDVPPEEVTPGVNIVHPLKSFDHPVRVHYRRFRQKIT